MTLTLRSTVEMTAAELAALFNHAFEGYIGGQASFTPVSFIAFAARDNIDLTLSRVAMQADQAVGIGLISQQGWTGRLSGMGVIPSAKGQGVGQWLLSQLIEEAQQRGDRKMILESFEQNTPAVRLYEKMGFRVVRRLLGYTADQLSGSPDAGLQEVDPVEAAKAVIAYGGDDLPWQASGAAVLRFAPPNRAYQLEDAYGVISDPNRETIVLRSVIVPPASRRQGQGKRLIAALAAQFPAKKWYIPPIIPAENDAFLQSVGFSPIELNQVQMERSLLD